MKVPLVDSCFFPRERSATLAGDRSGQGPTHFEWVEGPGEPVTFYTDTRLDEVVQDPGRKVAWLIEPPGAGRTHYQRALSLHEQFEHVLTYNALNSEPNYLFYPLGGSWIQSEDWAIYPKKRGVSLMVTDKRTMPGHRLRRRIHNEFPLDAYGRGVNPVDSKLEALAEYRYSVVVESYSLNYYFSEKLVDCLACGTIPIYWGCPGIDRFFEMDGIIQFETASELDYILLHVASDSDYRGRLDAIRANLELAWGYTCAEDWIYRHYGFLFE